MLVWLLGQECASGQADHAGEFLIALQLLGRLAASVDLTLEPVTPAQAHAAIDAYRAFGKVSKSPAKLNFGDCFAYALAQERGKPLLFKGEDFTHTDLEPAL